MFNADERAILFLCCAEHPIGCTACGKASPYRKLRRRSEEPGRLFCPRCRADVTEAVATHTTGCHYFVSRTSQESARPGTLTA